MESLKEWIHDHDDRWSFILPYVGGAILLSIFMSLFWVVLLMLGHFALELWRHRMLDIPNPVMHAFWHTKLDFSLIFFAFVIAIYAEMIIGALGIGQAARGAQIAARFGVIERSLRAVLLTVDEAGLLLRALNKGKNKKAAITGQVEELAATGTGPVQQSIARHVEMAKEDPAPWRTPTKGDWASIGFAAVCAALVVAAPLINDRDYAHVGHTILNELHP